MTFGRLRLSPVPRIKSGGRLAGRVRFYVDDPAALSRRRSSSRRTSGCALALKIDLAIEHELGTLAGGACLAAIRADARRLAAAYPGL